MEKEMVRSLYAFPDVVDGRKKDRGSLAVELSLVPGSFPVVRSLALFPLGKQTLRISDIGSFDVASAVLNVRLVNLRCSCKECHDQCQVEEAVLCETSVELKSKLSVPEGSMVSVSVPLQCQEAVDDDLALSLVLMVKEEEAFATALQLENLLDLTKPQLYRLSAAFSFCDWSGDGSLNAKDFARACEFLGFPLNAFQLRDFMLELGAHEEGSSAQLEDFIRTFGSTLKGKKQRILSETDIEKVRTAFELCDANGNGQIDIDELRMVLWKLGEDPSDEDLERFMKRFDTNRDGTIDLMEFARGFAAFEPSSFEFHSFSLEQLAHVSKFVEDKSERKKSQVESGSESIAKKRSDGLDVLGKVWKSFLNSNADTVTTRALEEALSALQISSSKDLLETLLTALKDGLDAFLSELGKIDFSKSPVDLFTVEGCIAMYDILDLRIKKGFLPPMLANPHRSVLHRETIGRLESDTNATQTCSIM